MKKAFSTFLILVFFVGIFRPYIPFIEYYINKEYIIEFLCINKDKPEKKCNGKCHLKNQLKKASENDGTSDKQKKNHPERKKINDFVGTISLKVSTFQGNDLCTAVFLFKWKSDYLHDIFIPPKQFHVI